MPKATCINCSKDFISKYGNVGKFCNQTCMGEHKRKETYERFLRGKVNDRGTIRKILLERIGKCLSCGIKDWKGNHLPLEVDHIDGNASNNKPDNVRLLCPNCHAITPTWKAKNKGKGRASRGLKLY